MTLDDVEPALLNRYLAALDALSALPRDAPAAVEASAREEFEAAVDAIEARYGDVVFVLSAQG